MGTLNETTCLYYLAGSLGKQCRSWTATPPPHVLEQADHEPHELQAYTVTFDRNNSVVLDT